MASDDDEEGVRLTEVGEARPFTIDVAEADVEDLVARLRRTRWPGDVRGSRWDDGADLSTMQELVRYWAEDFDWRARERELNARPQVRVAIDGFQVHAVHQRGVGPDPLPLVLTHGWPSSFVEWDAVIGPLSDPGAHGGDPGDAFHVVAPSLPGYGFSDIPVEPGTSPRRIAVLWVELMRALGYERFGAHGCDWGAYVTALLGLDHPERLAGAHMGMLSLRKPRASGRERSASDVAYGERVARWREREHGYIAIQSTKPQTLAYGLTDSPAGLAAWITEKWRAWSDCGGELESVISRDELLTNVSIYWFTGTINSANRLYYESRRDPVRLAEDERVPVPAGFLLETAPGQGGRPDKAPFQGVPRAGAPPRGRAEEVFDVRRWTEAPVGGHFPALETPELFVDEVRSFFRPLRSRTTRSS